LEWERIIEEWMCGGVLKKERLSLVNNMRKIALRRSRIGITVSCYRERVPKNKVNQ